MIALLIPTAGCDASGGESPPSGTSDISGATDTLRFAVGPSGKVSAPVSMDLHKGTDVKFKLDNRSTEEYRLRVMGPDGNKEAVVVVRPKHLGQTNLVLTAVGRHTVVVYRGGDPSSAGKYPLQVSG